MNTSKVLLALRGVAGAAVIVVGVMTYPTGHIVGDESAVPVAVALVGALMILHVLLDLLHAHVSQDSDGQSPTDGYRAMVSALVAALATVLGLVSAFTKPTTDAIRVGAAALVVGIFLGLLMFNYLVFSIKDDDDSALTFLGTFLAILITVSGFGLACIGLAVTYR